MTNKQFFLGLLFVIVFSGIKASLKNKLRAPYRLGVTPFSMLMKNNPELSFSLLMYRAYNCDCAIGRWPNGWMILSLPQEREIVIGTDNGVISLQ